MTNVEIFEQTREIYNRGSYYKDGREISLGFTPEQMREVTSTSAWRKRSLLSRSGL